MERNRLHCGGSKHYRGCRPTGTVAKFVLADNVGRFGRVKWWWRRLVFQCDNAQVLWLPTTWLCHELSHFLSFHRRQVIKCSSILSSSEQMNTGIVQGSGIDPMLYVIVESDLRMMSSMNNVSKMLMIRTSLHLPIQTMTSFRNMITLNSGLLKIK